MTTRSFQLSQKAQLGLFCLFSIFGLLGNHFKFPLFFGVDFIFGSIFSMLALRILGLRWALAATIIISSYTIRLWHQPYSMWIFVAEILFVGLSIQRWKLPFIISDIAYWLLAGLPLVFLLYAGVLSIPAKNVLFLWVKLALNGLLNVSLMRILFVGSIAFSRRYKISLSETTYDLLTFLILVPALFQVAFHVEADEKALKATTQQHLSSVRRNISLTLNSWFDLHLNQLQYLAQSAVTASVSVMQIKLEDTLKMGGDFLRIGYMDGNAISIAYTPLLDELGNSNIGKDFSDRPYLKTLREERRPMLSNVMMGRVGRPQPIVAMMAPVVQDNTFSGYVGGVIDLGGLELVIKNITGDGLVQDLAYTIVDQTGNIIVSSSQEEINSPYRQEEGTVISLAHNMYQITPLEKKNVSSVDIWKGTKYVTEQSIGNAGEWNLILKQPIAPLQQILYDRYKMLLGWIFAFLVCALLMVGFLSKRVFVSLTKVRDISSEIPDKIEANQEIIWPDTRILESAQLIDNFQKMISMVTALFAKIKQNNIELDQRIHERTLELSELSDMLNKAQNIGHIGSWKIDLVNRTVKVSAEIYKIFGLSPHTQLGYNTLSDHIHPDDKETVRQAWHDALQGNVYEIEHRIIVADQAKWVRVKGEIIFSADSQPSGAVFILQDITDQKQAAEEKQHMEEQLNQAQKLEAIGTLAGGIAHDFNNILSAILGYAELLKETIPLETPAGNYIDQILLASNRAKELVLQILTFSRKGRETQKPLQPASVIKEALKFLRASIPTTIEIEADIHPDSGTIMANPTNIHQVLVNLCTNAYHAMEATGGKLTVSLTRVNVSKTDIKGIPEATTGTFVQLMVKDTGQGMSKATAARIFEPYFTTKGIGKGSGMGLALVHGIVHSSGGFIKVESAPGVGTTMYAYFPAIQTQAEVTERALNQTLPTGDERILAVDDEQTIVEMHKATLEKLGYRVTAFHNSEEAYKCFQSAPNTFDLILTDQTMPHLPGSELAKKILEIRPDLPIILCTGYSSMISEEKAAKIGIKKFLMKPVSRQDLAFCVRETLDSNHSVS